MADERSTQVIFNKLFERIQIAFEAIKINSIDAHKDWHRILDECHDTAIEGKSRQQMLAFKQEFADTAKACADVIECIDRYYQLVDMLKNIEDTISQAKQDKLDIRVVSVDSLIRHMKG